MILSINSITYASNSEKNEIIKFNLKDAIDYAMENSRDIKIQKLELERAKSQHTEFSDYISKGDDEYKEEYYYALSLPPTHKNNTINKALKDNGAKKKNVDLALNIAKWNIELMENKIRYDVEKAYYNLLQKKEELDISNEGLKLVMEQYTQSEKMFELGTISQQQLLGAELGLYQAQSLYDSVLIEYELEKMSFNNTLGLPLMQEVELVGKIEFIVYEYIDFESDIKKAHENNALLKVASESKEIARLGLRAVENSSHNSGVFHREAVVELERADNNLQSMKDTVEISVRSSGMLLLNTGKQIKNYTTAVKKAQKNYELAKLSFELGKNTPNEVDKARIELMNAKRNLSKQIHAYKLALLDYNYRIGLGKDILR